MKHILNAISILLSAIIVFSYIAIIHVLTIIWEFKLNPKTKWRDKDDRRVRGKFSGRYKSWYKIIKKIWKQM